MKWTIDPTHSEVEFAVRHLMISTVKGRFKTFTGMGETNPDGTVRSVEMTIDAASIDTHVQQRDDHLRSPDFLDVATFPQVTFRSTGITQHGDRATLAGDLTIRGVTKPVTLTGEYSSPVTDPWGHTRAALQADAKINRKDWGLTWNMALEAGGWVVGDEVKLAVAVEAVAVPEHEPVAA